MIDHCRDGSRIFIKGSDIVWEGEVESGKGISTTRDRANNMHEVSDTNITRAATET